jgi:type III restriction enzyme
MNNPILNSPYLKLLRHFKSDVRGITDEILEFRRPSSYYIPVLKAKTEQQQLDLNISEGAYGGELQKENEFINKLRAYVKEWRQSGWTGLTRISRDLLSYFLYA